MASQAYKDLVSRTPKDVRKYVTNSLDIVEEIVTALDERDMKPADLAKALNKQESEISKWLSGLHNLTIKSISKIEAELDEDIIVTRSRMEAKITARTKRLISIIKKLKKVNEDLAKKIEKIEGAKNIPGNLRVAYSRKAKVHSDETSSVNMNDKVPMNC